MTLTPYFQYDEKDIVFMDIIADVIPQFLHN